MIAMHGIRNQTEVYLFFLFFCFCWIKISKKQEPLASSTKSFNQKAIVYNAGKILCPICDHLCVHKQHDKAIVYGQLSM